MCTSEALSPRTYNPVGKALGEDNYAKLDPLAGEAEKQQRDMEQMDEVPEVAAQPNPQEAKQPDRPARKRNGPAVGSTLLTGARGITNSALTTGAPTLLGA